MILTADRSGERADAALARLSGTLTRSAAQRLLEAGQVTSRGRVLKKNDRLEAGDPLEVEIPAPQPLELSAEDIPLDIVYEDGDLIVLNKPKGLVVHPAAGHWSGTLVNALLHHCRDSLSGINGALRPGIVHRIDKDTSGLLVVAKNDFAHQSLAAQLQDHSLARVYVCLVTGGMRADSGTVDAPIGKAHGRGGRWPPRRNSLAGAGAFFRLHAAGVPAGDRPHPPDPRPHGPHRPPYCGGYGLWPQKAGTGPGYPMPPRPGHHLPPSEKR